MNLYRELIESRARSLYEKKLTKVQPTAAVVNVKTKLELLVVLILTTWLLIVLAYFFVDNITYIKIPDIIDLAFMATSTFLMLVLLFLLRSKFKFLGSSLLGATYRYWNLAVPPIAILIVTLYGTKNIFWSIGLAVALLPFYLVLKTSLINMAEMRQGYVLRSDYRFLDYKNELVTIVIPCHNSGSTLARTLNSVVSQTHKSLEILLVDDASTDHSYSVAEEFRKRDSRIQILKLDANVGLPGARNHGLEFANGKYVVFLDADDVLTDMAISLRLHWLKSNGGVSAVACRAKRMNTNEKSRLWRTEPAIGKPTVLTHGKNKSNNPFAIHEVLLITADVTSAGAFDAEMINGGEDTDFWLRYLLAGNSVLKLPIYDSIYFQSSTSMMATSLTEHGLRMVDQISNNANSSEEASLLRPEGDGDVKEFGAEVTAQRRLFEYLGAVTASGDPEGFVKLQQELEGRKFHRIIDSEEALSLMVKGSLRQCQRNKSKLGLNEFDKIYKMHSKLGKYMAGSQKAR